MRVDEEILERRKEQRAEMSALTIGMLEQIPIKHHYKEILGQVLRILDRVTAVADESKNRPPISAAKMGERFAGFFLVGI